MNPHDQQDAVIKSQVKADFDSIRAPAPLVESTIALLTTQEFADTTGSPSAAHLTPPAAKPRRRFARRIAYALAACLLLVARGVGGVNVYATPTAYIQLEVNPSIELGINRFDRVVSATGLNGDGTAILSGVDVLNQSYEEAIDTLLSQSGLANYTSGDYELNINVFSNDSAQMSSINQGCSNYIATHELRGACHEATEQVFNEAAAAGMGVARYQVALQLMEADPGLTIEDCQNMTMRQMRDLLAQLQGQHHNGGNSKHSTGHE
jgi:hypothetical protein